MAMQGLCAKNEWVSQERVSAWDGKRSRVVRRGAHGCRRALRAEPPLRVSEAPETRASMWTRYVLAAVDDMDCVREPKHTYFGKRCQ